MVIAHALARHVVDVAACDAKIVQLAAGQSAQLAHGVVVALPAVEFTHVLVDDFQYHMVSPMCVI